MFPPAELRFGGLSVSGALSCVSKASPRPLGQACVGALVAKPWSVGVHRSPRSSGASGRGAADPRNLICESAIEGEEKSGSDGNVDDDKI